jgi:hypothetical protein
MKTSKSRVALLMALLAAGALFFSYTTPAQAASLAITSVKEAHGYLCVRFCGSHCHHHGHVWCGGYEHFWCPGHH